MIVGMTLGSMETRAPMNDGVGDEQRMDPEGRSPSESDADDGNREQATAGIGDAYDSNRRYPRRRGTPHRYPEWDDDRRRYASDAVTVWTEAAPSAAAGAETVSESSVVSRRLRSQFEQLRVRRQTSRRQFSGDALDLAALTDALVDRRMGRSPDERVYERTQANRRTLAIGVLADVSGSTGNQLEDGARIIDLEKQALLMAHHALEAVGDPYAMFAFASLGAHDVQVLTVKGFEEHGSVARPRIHALQPDQNTRLGAAVRHASRVLATQPAANQLLLVITDGRPSDMNYHEDYAVADTRRAILDARNQGTTVFGLAIDFEDHEYLAEIFGTAGYVYVRDPHSLARQLVGSIASMLRS
jgi:nitric oxide reductase NorD protein